MTEPEEKLPVRDAQGSLPAEALFVGARYVISSAEAPAPLAHEQRTGAPEGDPQAAN